MGSLGADSRGGIDSFPKVELVIFERRVWKEGTVRNKSQKSKRGLQDLDQQKSTFSGSNACAVRRDVRRWKRKEDDRASHIIVLPGTTHFLNLFFYIHFLLLFTPKTLLIGV